MYKRCFYPILFYLLGITGCLSFSGCSDEAKMESADSHITIPFEVNAGQRSLLTSSFEDNSHSVNRILILPFRKTSEGATDDDANFVPEYTAARQMDVRTFPAWASLLELSPAYSWKVVIIGYNSSDYDFAFPSQAGTRFAINSAVLPATLANLQLYPASPAATPEFFSCVCNAYIGTTSAGSVFKPQQGMRLEGNLTRLVSGLSLELTNVPAFVDSISLVAEQLVTSIRTTDGTPMQWQTAGDSGPKQLANQAPVQGGADFNVLLLPTTSVHNTQLFLDIHYAGLTERYTVKVNDVPGVSLSNKITFASNQVVHISGSYASINIGFVITGNINLDDDAWDGIQ